MIVLLPPTALRNFFAVEVPLESWVLVLCTNEIVACAFGAKTKSESAIGSRIRYFFMDL